MRERGFTRWIVAVPMCLLALATIYPMLFTLNVAMKSRREYVLNQFSLADHLTAANVADAWSSSGLGRYTLNSIVVTAGAVALLLLLGSMAGYAFSQVTFRGRKWLFLVCLGALMIPFQVIMVPFFRVLGQVHLLDTYPGLILAYTGQFLPFTIFLMTSFYSRIPAEVVEAARVDGSTTLGVYRRIMLPLGRPALLSVGILNALFCWNDVLISLLVMQSEQHRTLMVGVTALRGQYSDNIPLFAGGVLVAAVPVIAIYLFFQRQITDGVTAGSTKG
ncbi:multiple sugar transport system permease protein [Kribbella aluminosa]|uniref:Multiple sugar transport system permease protein n=1 Tax=Kribbella aluminosa TaxID=416017 RepID=A0ABS4UK84_9ACTN|nr:carbohydrate ABC transporter permease [Kribbella aluminosa]MBP2351939.1 multiple sugar transport system permease protein [Kribbella aluminosa]